MVSNIIHTPRGVMRLEEPGRPPSGTGVGSPSRRPARPANAESAAMFKVTFVDRVTREEWTLPVRSVPARCDLVLFDQAPKGKSHIVESVLHCIGAGEHRIIVTVSEFPAP
jgi:hypothetical protein